MSSGRIYIIEQASGVIMRTLEGHTAPVRGWTVDENRGWSCGGDGKLVCWDVQTGSCLRYVA
jgi:WD40 repeat protein